MSEGRSDSAGDTLNCNLNLLRNVYPEEPTTARHGKGAMACGDAAAAVASACLIRNGPPNGGPSCNLLFFRFLLPCSLRLFRRFGRRGFLLRGRFLRGGLLLRLLLGGGGGFLFFLLRRGLAALLRRLGLFLLDLV